MANVRHCIVIRRDLNLKPGALAAQAIHISDGFMRNGVLLQITDDKEHFDRIQKEWISEPVVAILAVNTPEELNDVAKCSKEIGLRVTEWRDHVYSEILGRPIRVLVGISIGPDETDKIREATGMLPSY